MTRAAGIPCSANEIEALAAKAARGAGAGVAQAAHFGRAAVAHLAAGRGGDDLLAALRRLPGGPITDLPVALAVATGQVTMPADAVGSLLDSYIDALPYEARVLSRDEDRVTLSVQIAQRRAVQPPARIALDERLRDALAALAQRTYVPASDASRLGGAGAGLTDND